MRTFLRTFFHSRAGAAGLTGLLPALLFVGCTQSNQQATVTHQPPAPVQPVGAVAAREAFWPMYKAAHDWSSDVMVLRLTAKSETGFHNENGKAALWEAVFASSSRGKVRVFRYSVADVPPEIYKGVNGGLELPWTGVSRDAMPVDLSQFNIDSDEAYKTASLDAADWLRKNPNKDVAMLQMGDTSRFADPVWLVMWGTKTAGYAAYVDASNGKVLKR